MCPGTGDEAVNRTDMLIPALIKLSPHWSERVGLILSAFLDQLFFKK